MNHILKITKSDLDINNYYIGSADVTNWIGSIEIDGDLDWVRFKTSLRVSKCIHVKDGSGIKTSDSIEAGDSIEVGWGIKAGHSIESGHAIKAGHGIEAGDSIEVGRSIKAGWGIESGYAIKAGHGIEAGFGIKAGHAIEAGHGIEAGLSIDAETISSKLRIFAGLCIWKLPSATDMQIRAKLIEGTIGLGELIEPKFIEPDQVDVFVFNSSVLTPAEITKLRKLIT